MEAHEEKEQGKKMMLRGEKKLSLLKAGSLTGLLFLVVLGVLMLLMSRYPLRLDLTATKLNTLSPVSKAIVAKLRDPMRIKIFISPNLPPPLNAVEQSLADLLQEYQQAANDNFYYTFYRLDEKEADVSPQMKENIELAGDYGIFPRSLQSIDKDEVKLVSAYSGVVIEYGDIIERIDFITESVSLEYRLSSVFRKVTDKVNTLLSLEKGAIRITSYVGQDFIELAPFFGIQNLASYPEQLAEEISRLSDENYSRIVYSNENRIVADDLLARIGFLQARLHPWESFGIDGTNYAAGTGAAFLTVEYEEQVEVLELLSQEETVRISERGLESVLRYTVIPVANIAEQVEGIVNRFLQITPALAYLQGKGTVDLAQESTQTRNPQNIASAVNLASAVKSRYELLSVSLAELSPDTHPVLMVIGPKEPFTDYELFLLDQYLMKGGSLLLFLDSFVENPQQGFPGGLGNSIPTWRANETGLEKLMEHYGVRIDSSVVMDRVSFVSRGQDARGIANEQAVYFVSLIKNDKMNGELPYLKNVRGVFFIAGSPLFPVDDMLETRGISGVPLVSSSDRSWNVSEDVSLVPFLIQPPADEEAYTSFDLAYALEGSFSSYFVGKELPRAPASSDDGDNVSQRPATNAVQFFTTENGPHDFIEEAPERTKIVLFSSSEIIKNNVFDPAGQYPNAVFTLNMIDVVSGAEDWAVMRSKGQRVNPLDGHEEGGEPPVWFKRPTFIKTFNFIGWPILIALIGLFVYSLKRRRRQNIVESFKAMASRRGGAAATDPAMVGARRESVGDHIS